MELNIKSEYFVYKLVNHSYVDSDSYDDLKEALERYFEGDTIVTRDDIREEIEEFIFDNCFETKNNEAFEEVEKISLINMKEVLDSFNYLLRDQKCCNKAPYGSNYCPTCGKRIKN